MKKISINNNITEQKMNTDHRFRSRNKKELFQVEAIEVAANILQDKLKISNDWSLQAQRQVGWAGADAFHVGMCDYHKKLLKINFRNLNGFPLSVIIEVLAHEFRHAVQYKTGLLNDIGATLSGRRVSRWTGPKLKAGLDNGDGLFSRYSRWYSKPEEQDAMMFEQPYSQIIYNDVRFKPYMKSLQSVFGKKIMKEDRAAGLARLKFDVDGIQLLKMSRNSLDKRLWWMHTSQIPGCKKWTQKWVNLAFKDYSRYQKKQIFKPVMVPITPQDFTK